jgi:hypothetical protein
MFLGTTAELLLIRQDHFGPPIECQVKASIFSDLRNTEKKFEEKCERQRVPHVGKPSAVFLSVRRVM